MNGQMMISTKIKNRKPKARGLFNMYARNSTFMILPLIGLFLLGRAAAQNAANPVNLGNNNDIAVNAGFADPDIRYPAYFKNTATYNKDYGELTGILNLAKTYQITGWQGERVFMQLLIQANEPVNGCSVIAQGLQSMAKEGTSKAGTAQKSVDKTIKASYVKAGFVGYVLSNGIGASGSGCGIDTATQHLSYVVADRIGKAAINAIGSGKNQPVWVGVQIPENATPGLYKGTLRMVYQPAGGKKREELFHYQLEVKNHTLPAASQWKFHLDLWQYPMAVARWYQVEPWSKAHFEKMRPYMQWLARAGQKVITAGIIHDPWNGQTYDAYPSMVKWTRHKDGSWSYDYRIFDKWVQFMMDMGINQQINCYSMVPWHNTFTYFDEATGADKKLVATPGTPEYNSFWKNMLEDFARHLKAKGWFDKTCIAMDERPLEAMQKVISLIKGLPHPFKLSLAGSYHKELDKEIYDYSITTRESYDQEVLHRRLAAGLPTTYYTCCSEDHPNTFSFSPAAEAAFIPLLSASRQLTGYLRWAYNAWPENPLTDSRFGSWSSGDTYLVYPGPQSAVRFEQLIRGIQDFEKIRLLKESFKAAHNERALENLEKVLSQCTVENLKKQGAKALVQAVETTINQY